MTFPETQNKNTVSKIKESSQEHHQSEDTRVAATLTRNSKDELHHTLHLPEPYLKLFGSFLSAFTYETFSFSTTREQSKIEQAEVWSSEQAGYRCSM